MDAIEAKNSRELSACNATGYWPLSWGVTILEEKGLKIKAVTLRKYCERGKIGRKLGGSWLVTEEELERIAATPTESRRAGRPRKS